MAFALYKNPVRQVLPKNPNTQQHLEEIARILNRQLELASFIGYITLDPNVLFTDVTDERMREGVYLHMIPITATAAAENWYIQQNIGRARIHHANNTITDRIYIGKLIP